LADLALGHFQTRSKSMKICPFQRLALAGVMAGFVGMAAVPAMAGSASADCAATSDEAIAQLFDDWNEALATRDPDAVVALYGENSVLLPTLSNQVRYTPDAKRDYFVHFLQDGPQGSIDEREILLGCNTAIDTGLYTFAFEDTGDVAHARFTYTYGLEDGHWRITSHHSSLMPEPME
jgi:uncharacterized protein (TIGR02246 family)